MYLFHIAEDVKCGKNINDTLVYHLFCPYHIFASFVSITEQTHGNVESISIYCFYLLDAPHGHLELEFKDVQVPASNVILGMCNGVHTKIRL